MYICICHKFSFAQSQSCITTYLLMPRMFLLQFLNSPKISLHIKQCKYYRVHTYILHTYLCGPLVCFQVPMAMGKHLV